MASNSSIINSTENNITTENETNNKKRISENNMLGKGNYKKVYDIKEDDTGSFIVDNDFNIDNYVIANISIDSKVKKKEELEKLQEELKLQVELSEGERSVKVIQINYYYYDSEPCNINVSSSDDIDKICDDTKNNIENLEKISVLMEKCNAQTIWSIQNIEQEFNELINYLVDTKNMMLIDIKPANLCIHNNKLIALDLDPGFIKQNLPDEAKTSAKACMFLIFSIILWFSFNNDKLSSSNKPN